MKNYKELINRINAQTNPENFELDMEFLMEMSEISYSDVKRYIHFAMKGVENEYTQRCLEAGKKVKGHLRAVLQNVSFEYQGSVMTNTHIKATSDIDLLVLSELFYFWDRSSLGILTDYTARSEYSETQLKRIEKVRDSLYYQGDSMADLMRNRIQSEAVLTSVYEECDVSKERAIRLHNKSLKKEVDVVLASWYDNLESIVNGQDLPYRGVQVFNKSTRSSENATYPFLSITLINQRSIETNGRLKKMIRFLKNIKASINSAHEKKVVEFTSFEINAIIYDVPISEYQNANVYQLVQVVHAQLVRLFINEEYRSNLKSVDGNERINLSNAGYLHALILMINELKSIIDDLQNEQVL